MNTTKMNSTINGALCLALASGAIAGCGSAPSTPDPSAGNEANAATDSYTETNGSQLLVVNRTPTGGLEATTFEHGVVSAKITLDSTGTGAISCEAAATTVPLKLGDISGSLKTLATPLRTAVSMASSTPSQLGGTGAADGSTPYYYCSDPLAQPNLGPNCGVQTCIYDNGYCTTSWCWVGGLTYVNPMDCGWWS